MKETTVFARSSREIEVKRKAEKKTEWREQSESHRGKKKRIKDRELDENVKKSKSGTLARKRKIGAGATETKGGFPREVRKVPREKGRASKENHQRRNKRKHEPESGHKSSPSLEKPEMGNEVRRQRAC